MASKPNTAERLAHQLRLLSSQPPPRMTSREYIAYVLTFSPSNLLGIAEYTPRLIGSANTLGRRLFLDPLIVVNVVVQSIAFSSSKMARSSRPSMISLSLQTRTRESST